MSTTAQYLKTLRRIPDDIVLSMATRDLDVGSVYSCLCAWAIREAVGGATDEDPEAVPAYIPLPGLSRRTSPDERCRNWFGGSVEEWDSLFLDVTCEPEGALIEDAFVTRVMEAAGVAA